ncbi:MAG: SAM-dependent methyltransferase [Erysipelotrichaceae bacterium]|nr:SAM-dependent methyltransferase [Erysipelotrichaceae bacterium]
MISKRIRKIASLIDNDSSVTDVGCDHGYLAICLREAGNKQRIVCSDNKNGPLENARKNLERQDYENIAYVLSDGLKNIDEMTDTVVMAGMGYLTMRKIILESYEKFAGYVNIILQSNNSLPKLRRFLNQNGFEIVSEHMVHDDIYYTVIIARKGEQLLEENQYEFGFNLAKEDRKIFIEHWNHEITKREQILQGIDPSSKGYEKIAGEIRKIREVL